MVPRSISMQLSIVIPVHNEDKNIASVLGELLESKLFASPEIIAVDDASTDRTPEVLGRFAGRIKVIRHPVNRGYGASLKTGIRAAEGEYVLTFDGDGQFDPKYIGAFYELASREGFDLVAGERIRGGEGSPAARLPFKWGLKLLIYGLFGVWLKDLNCGYRIFRRSTILKYLHVCSDAFSFSTTSTLALLDRHYSVTFLPIQVRLRKENASSVVRSGTVANIFQLMLRTATLFHPLRVFLPVGFGSIAFGILWSLRYLVVGRGLSILALLFILFGVITAFVGLLTDQIAEMRKERFEQ